MVSTVKVVFLIDIHCFSKTMNRNCEKYQSFKSKICLCCLKLLTEFGALTETGNDQVSWSFKFYNSTKFRSDTTKKVFIDFNKTSFDELAIEIEKYIDKENPNANTRTLRTRKYSNISIDSNSSTSTTTNNDRLNVSTSKSASENLQSHSFILKKALQEILLDYNWDSTDISSPVKLNKTNLCRPTRGKTKSSAPHFNLDFIEEFNFVIVLTNIPSNLRELSEFIGQSNSNSKKESKASDFVSTLFNSSMISGFKNEKRIRVHFINTSNQSLEASLKQRIQVDLNKLLSGIHEIDNLVQSKQLILSDGRPITEKDSNLYRMFSNAAEGLNDSSLHFSELCIYDNDWWNKQESSPSSLVSQEGPVLLWEDANGIYFLNIKLRILYGLSE